MHGNARCKTRLRVPDLSCLCFKMICRGCHLCDIYPGILSHLNSYKSSIQFTAECETNCAWLSRFKCIQGVYQNPPHTDKCLAFHSHHLQSFAIKRQYWQERCMLMHVGCVCHLPLHDSIANARQVMRI